MKTYLFQKCLFFKKCLFKKLICKKLIVYMSASFIFASAMPPVHAAETAQPSGTQTENVPSNNTQTDTVPSDNTSVQNPPADGTNIPAGTDTANPPPAQNPNDVVITPQPDTPAADGSTVGDSVGNPVENTGITPIQATIYVAASGGVNVRSGPSTNDSILGKLKYGTALTAIGQTSDNWYQVQYAGGTGYVRADTVTDTPVTVTPPATQSPSATTQAPEISDTQASAIQNPDDGNLIPEETAPEEISEEETGETTATETTRLFGTPVIVVLVLAIIGVLALITLSVIGLFKKDNVPDAEYDDVIGENDGEDEYFEACYYEDDDDDEKE